MYQLLPELSNDEYAALKADIAFENLDAAGVVRFWMRKQEGELSVLGGAAASGS